MTTCEGLPRGLMPNEAEGMDIGINSGKDSRGGPLERRRTPSISSEPEGDRMLPAALPAKGLIPLLFCGGMGSVKLGESSCPTSSSSGRTRRGMACCCNPSAISLAVPSLPPVLRNTGLACISSSSLLGDCMDDAEVNLVDFDPKLLLLVFLLVWGK